MKKYINLLFWSFLLVQICSAQDYRREIKAIYDLQKTALLKIDLAGLMAPYGQDAVVMPEYHLTLFGKTALEAYYREYLGSVSVTEDERTITGIMVIKDKLVESGTFRRKLVSAGKADFLYQGN